MSPRSNPLDRATIADVLAWVRTNKLAAMAILGLGGANFIPGAQQARAEVEMTAAEYAALITGMNESCQRSKQ